MDASLTDAVVAASITTLATGLGGVPFLFVRTVPLRWAQLSWAVAGGMMLAASVFNLILPGIQMDGIMPVAVGVLVGTLTFGLAARSIEHHDFTISGVSGDGAGRIMLILGTMFIHSFPEGLAVGVAFGSGEVGLGLIMTLAISIHNIPEGIAVSLPLRAEGVSGWKCIFWSIVSSLPQPVAAIPAYLAVIAFRPVLPFAFGLAAGAMFYLVLSEMVPESRANESQRQSSALASMGGFLGMMLIQNLISF
jgi:ZIP family zinc transporter